MGETMRLANTTIVFMISWALLTTAAYADLDSPTYAKAKEEYTKGDCNKALDLLKRYRSEDGVFLNNNPKILSSIENAIDYCMTILFPSLPGTSYPTGPPQQPDLPVNLAHAFDTEARLRGVIAELKSGKPVYEQMEPMLRISLRQQITALASRLQALGALISISHEGEQQNADVYEVKFANGVTAWMIGIAPNGKITTLICQ
jgi:hypothetical protein